MLRWTATGTQRGAFGPIPPTGRVVTYAGVHVFTVEGEQITDLWSLNDTFAKVIQLGAEIRPPCPGAEFGSAEPDAEPPPPSA